MLPPDLQRLKHIRDYCCEIKSDIQAVDGSFAIFMSNKMCQRSITQSMTQIGELCRGLSDEFKQLSAGVIPWIQIRAMRNSIVHNYGKLDFETVWKTALNDIPALKAFCETQLAAFDEHKGG